MSKSNPDAGAWVLAALLVLFLLGLLIYGFRDRTPGEDRRHRRQRRAKRRLDAEHAREKETEKVLPRAVATIKAEPDAPKHDTHGS